MRFNKLAVAYKLVQLCRKNPKKEPWHIIIKTQNNKALNKDQKKHYQNSARGNYAGKVKSLKQRKK